MDEFRVKCGKAWVPCKLCGERVDWWGGYRLGEIVPLHQTCYAQLAAPADPASKDATLRFLFDTSFGGK